MRAWTAFHLPPGWSPDSVREVPLREVPVEDSRSRRRGGNPSTTFLLAELSPARADGLVRSLREGATALRARPIRDLIRVLGGVGDRLLDPGDPLRVEAEARIPAEAAFSKEMARAVIDGMAKDWTQERLERLVSTEFPDPLVLDCLRPNPQGDRIRATGGRFAFHVGSGNVPGVGATSLIRSLLVKCPVLLKPGRGDVALSLAVAQGIAEADEALARALAVVYWRGEEGGLLEEAALREAERVVVYGGAAVISRLRDRTPITTPIVAYPHRVSIGLVLREELVSPARAKVAAADAAYAVAFFDQRGCVSPQMIWVEEGARVTPAEWAFELANELESLAQVLPRGPIDAEMASQIHQIVGTNELRKAAGSGGEALASSAGQWAVLFDPATGEIDPGGVSPGGRTVRVRPLQGLDRLLGALEPLRGVLQTLAIASGAAARSRVAELVVECGVTRVTTFREQPWPPAWWRHDGQGPLLALVQWTVLES